MPIPASMDVGRRLAEIAEAFAEAVAEGNLEAAEGWLAVAGFVRDGLEAVGPAERARQSG